MYKDQAEGLSQSHVFSINQDPDGFIWLCTMSGLNKFDGTNFTIYNSSSEDSTTLSWNWINSFFVDSKSRYWVSTTYGFNKLDRKTGKFKRYYSDSTKQNSLGQNHCKGISEDNEGYLWIAHYKGVDRFNPENETFEHYTHSEFKLSRHSGSVHIDKLGDIWLGAETGLYKVNKKTKSLDRFVQINLKTKGPQEVLSIVEDQNNQLWLGNNSGISLFNKTSRTFTNLKIDGLTGGTHCVIEHPIGIMNIGSIADGLIRYDYINHKVVKHYKYNAADPDGLQGDNIYSLFVDRQKNLWIGLFFGFSMIPAQGNQYKILQLEKGKNNIHNTVMMACDDKDENFFINTLKGFYFVDKNLKYKTEILFEPDFEKGTQEITNLTMDLKGEIYCTRLKYGLYKFDPLRRIMIKWDDEDFFKNLNQEFLITNPLSPNELIIPSSGTIYYYNTSTKKYNKIVPQNLNNKLKSGKISRLKQAKNGDLYFVLNKNLCVYKPYLNKIDILYKNEANGILGNITNLTIIDSALWIGSTHYIYKYELITNLIYRTDTLLNFPKYFSTMEVDKYNRIFIGKHNTMFKYEPKTNIIRKFSIADGKSSIINKTYNSFGKKLYFCMSNGLCIIDADGFKRDSTHPSIFITEIKVLNKIYSTTIQPEYLENIEIPYQDKSLSIKFKSNHFIRNHSIEYYYQLEGFENEFQYNENKGEVQYTNLPPGKYTFKAYAITEDGVKSEKPISLAIRVVAPFYMTNAFYSLVAIFIIGLLSLYYKITQRSRELVRRNELVEKNAKYKSMFMANMSHEIRTPMNAIIGLNKLLLNTPLDQTQEQYVKAINSSSENLLFIVNDILDQAKIESGKYSIILKYFDLIGLLDQLNTLLSIRAAEKDLIFKIEVSDKIPQKLKGDPVRLFQILTNLINNAIKFTNEGEVVLQVDPIDTNSQNISIKFSVKDTGIGIPLEKLSEIFDSFEQIHEKEIIGNQGTGLGLTISKHLVELLGGDLKVNSTHGKGSDFHFVLKFDFPTIDQQIHKENSIPIFNKSHKILLVEDTPLNQLVATELIKKYMPGSIIHLAENGQIAIDKISLEPFDLVLMDVKMPVMDGITATKKIRLSEVNRIKITPIVGLTANAIDEQIQECLKSGMNDYVTKPIDPKDLFTKIKKQLES
ncbi:MAG: response regulator [Saprospiraceae bacterium]|nr:response regulator [Saprospiraceae bacterium]MBK9631572.1 response regulator [Saprospiraceae bacterium]